MSLVFHHLGNDSFKLATRDWTFAPFQGVKTLVRQNPWPFLMLLGSVSLKHFVLLFRRFIFCPDPRLFLTLTPSSLQNQPGGRETKQ